MTTTDHQSSPVRPTHRSAASAYSKHAAPSPAITSKLPPIPCPRNASPLLILMGSGRRWGSFPSLANMSKIPLPPTPSHVYILYRYLSECIDTFRRLYGVPAGFYVHLLSATSAPSPPSSTKPKPHPAAADEGKRTMTTTDHQSSPVRPTHRGAASAYSKHSAPSPAIMSKLPPIPSPRNALPLFILMGRGRGWGSFPSLANMSKIPLPPTPSHVYILYRYLSECIDTFRRLYGVPAGFYVHLLSATGAPFPPSATKPKPHPAAADEGKRTMTTTDHQSSPVRPTHRGAASAYPKHAAPSPAIMSKLPPIPSPRNTSPLLILMGRGRGWGSFPSPAIMSQLPPIPSPRNPSPLLILMGRGRGWGSFPSPANMSKIPLPPTPSHVCILYRYLSECIDTFRRRYGVPQRFSEVFRGFMSSFCPRQAAADEKNPTKTLTNCPTIL